MIDGDMKPRTCLLICCWLAGLVVGVVPGHGATVRTWDGHFGGSWSNPNNWNPVGVPENGDDLIFQITAEQPSPVRTMHNDIVGLQIRKLFYCDDGWSLDGNELTLLDRMIGFITNTCNGSFTFFCPLELGDRAIIHSGKTLILRGNIDLNGNDLFLQSSDQMIVSGQIIGTGNIIATVYSFNDEHSKIVFDGPTGNTFSGKLTVRQAFGNGGEVVFDKQFGNVVNDALLIGDLDFFFASRAVCKLARSHQIGDAAEVCVTGGSQFLLDGHTETIGSLCLTNNSPDTAATLVDTGGATLSVQGDIIAVNDAAGVIPTIKGKLGLPGPAPSGAKVQSAAASSSTNRRTLRTADVFALVPGNGRHSPSESPKQILQVTK